MYYNGKILLKFFGFDLLIVRPAGGVLEALLNIDGELVNFFYCLRTSVDSYLLKSLFFAF